MQVDFHPDATIELTESADWYADRSPSVCRNFLVAVDIAIASIDRMEVVDEPMKASRTRGIELFADDPDLQRKLVDLLKPMPHNQALMDGKLSLEREFRELYRAEPAIP